MIEDRMDCIVMGRLIGTASGWDHVDDQAVCFYAFESVVEDIPSGDNLFVDLTEGNWSISDENGEKAEGDLIPILATLPRRTL